MGILKKLCMMCHAFKENKDHIFKIVQPLRSWEQLLQVWWKDATINNDYLDNVIRFNSIHKKGSRKKDIMDTISRSFLWVIWMYMNGLTFNN